MTFQVTYRDPNEYGYDYPAVFVCCTTCGGYSWFQKSDASDTRTTTCHPGGHAMTVDFAKVPDHFSPQSYAASPDGSCLAYWVKKNERGATVAPTEKRPPIPQSSGLGDLEAQVERLAALRDYEKANRARFADDPILLEAFDRLIARKKRTIMGNPD